MLGRMLGKIIIILFLLVLVTTTLICVFQRQRSLDNIRNVSTRFVENAGKLDLVGVRNCLTNESRDMLPSYYTYIAAKKLSELNKDVRINVHVEVIDIKMGGGKAIVKLKCIISEHGARLGKPVDNKNSDTCAVVCVYNGKKWLVDLDRTINNKQSPANCISILKERIGK